jgi:glycosyltransferase involved in cell wall biosynthesis
MSTGRLPVPVAVVMASFAGGGAERVLLNLVRALPRMRFAPRLIVLDGAGPLAALVPPDVPVDDLRRPRLRDGLLPLLGTLRCARPRVVLSTMGYLNLAVLALRPLLHGPVRIVVREANSPAASLAATNRPRAAAWACRRLYPKADAVVAGSRAVVRELAGLTGLGRIAVLPNPVDVAAVRAAAARPAREPGPGRRFVAAGRLVPQKGYDRLIRLLPALAPEDHLTILGEGPARDALMALAIEVGVADRIAMPGFAPAPWAAMAGADALVLPSRWEGMPNAALEALACGTPVLATPEAGGIAELAAEAPPGAVTIAAPDDAFAAALLAVRPAPPQGLRPSLLPARYALDAAVEAFTAVLEP